MEDVINLRIPRHIKRRFHDLCRSKSSYMTTEIIRLIHLYIKHEEASTSIQSSLPKDLEIPKSSKKTTHSETAWLMPELDDHQENIY